MRAAVITGVGRVEVQERPDPQPAPRHVVVHVDVASLCGTDAHQYEGRIDSPFPRVPGHDFAGTVVAVGEVEDEALVGRQFAVKPSIPCGECAACANGPSLDCPRKKLMGLWFDGCFAELVAVPGSTSCPSLTGCRCGAGRCWSPSPSGSTASTGCRSRWGTRCWCSARARSGWRSPGWPRSPAPGNSWSPTCARRCSPVSRAFGATECLDSRDDGLVDRVLGLTGGRGADVVVDTCGAPAATASVIDLVRGKASYIGYANDLPGIPVVPMMLKTLTVFGVAATGGGGSTSGRWS